MRQEQDRSSREECRQVRTSFTEDAITVYQAYSEGHRRSGSWCRALPSAIQAGKDDLDQALLPLDDVSKRLGNQARARVRAARGHHTIELEADALAVLGTYRPR